MIKVALLAAARSEALFTSNMPTGSAPTLAEAAQEIKSAVLRHGGTRGCAAEVAAAYGDYPDEAAARMRWARHVVEVLYPSRIQPAVAQLR